MLQPNKNSIFGGSHCSYTMPAFAPAQCLHVIFSFEIGLNGQMHSSSDSNHPIKKFLSKIPYPAHRGRISPHLLTLFGKVWLFLDPPILPTPPFLWENSEPTLFGKMSKTSSLLSTQLCLTGEVGGG